jgi:hypothetical protein
MNAEDKQVTVGDTTGDKLQIKHAWRRILFGVIALVVLAAIAFGVQRVLVPPKTARSNKLISQVKGFEDGKHTCKDGLPVIDQSSYDLINTTNYTQQARETGLDYLVKCSFIQGNSQQALSYATQLDQLYAKDGTASAPKRLQLKQLVTYIKNYNQ